MTIGDGCREKRTLAGFLTFEYIGLLASFKTKVLSEP